MGWTGVCGYTSAERRASIIAHELTYENERVAQKVTANKGKWCKVERLDKSTGKVEKNLVIILMKKGGDMVYDKVMDVSVHPYYYDCPLSWVKEFEPYDGEEGNSAQWKANALKYWEKKANGTFQVIPNKVYYLTNGEPFRIIGAISRVKYRAIQLSTGCTYAVRKRQIDFDKVYVEPT